MIILGKIKGVVNQRVSIIKMLIYSYIKYINYLSLYLREL